MHELILSALEGHAGKSLEQMNGDEINNTLKMTIEMSVWFGDLLRRQLKEAGHSPQVIDAIMVDTKFHRKYYEKLGIKFNKDGEVQ